MKTSEMMESKYIKTADVDGECVVTIKGRGLKKANLARDDEEPKYRWTIMFNEFPKPMVLNPTNIKRLEKALGDDTDDWEGNQVMLYVDENVQFGSDTVSGLRLRGIKSPAAKARARTAGDDDEEINRKLADAEVDPFK